MRRDRGTDTATARGRLARMLDAESGFDLVEGALLIAHEEYPGIDPAAEARRVRVIAGEAARRATPLDNPFARLEAVTGLIYSELGFQGNVRDFSDPRNSYLNEVLRRRLGIPLTLGILLLEAARAAGFDSRGVGLPGHLVVRLAFDGRTLFADPFNRGQVVTEDDCRTLIQRTTGRPSLFRREMLEGVDDRALVARMLLNLKHLYVQRKDYRRALAAVERLLLIRPRDPGELRDRGFLKAHLGRPAGAIEDLETYLSRSPTAPDVESVKGRLHWLKRHLTELN